MSPRNTPWPDVEGSADKEESGGLLDRLSRLFRPKKVEEPKETSKAPTIGTEGSSLGVEQEVKDIKKVRREAVSSLDAERRAEAKATAEAKPAAAPSALEAERAAQAKAEERTYVVKSGDYLSKIAKELYGDASRWPEIYEANKALIGDNPNLIHPGQKLRIP